MCLTAKTKRPQKATEDIVCYKMLLMYKRGLYSPYRNTYVRRYEKIIGNTHRPSLNFVWKADYHNDINGGAIHTYAKKHKLYNSTHIVFDDKTGLPYYDKNSQNRFFKCIIPKGTYYWEGISDDYAAKKIVYVEEIDPSKDEGFLNHLSLIPPKPVRNIVKSKNTGKKKKKRKAKLRHNR